MHKLNRKNGIQLAVLTVIFVIASVLVYKTTILTRMIMPRIETQVKAEEGLFYNISSGDRIEQSFTYDSDALLSAGVRISLNENVLQTLINQEEKKKQEDYGTLHLEILDETGICRMSADYDVRILDNQQNLIASLPAAENGWKGKTFTIVLEAENINENLNLGIGYTTKNVENAELKINGEICGYTLNIQTADHQFLYWKMWAVFGAALIYVMLVGTYLALAVLDMKPEKVFLFTGAILGIIYMLLLPPLSVPDEEAHLKQAYYYSNQIMGVEQPKDGALCMDLEDFHAMQKFETTPSLSEYDTLKDEIRKLGREKGTKEIAFSDTQAPMVTYLPGILGLTIGRLFGLNGILVICLGRICSLLFYLFTMYLFIRLMPFGKSAAFIMAILPMTIQQCTSYSYDSVVIEMAFIYLAVLLQLLYQEKPIEKWQMAVYAVCVIILSICKGGTYIPLCLLTLLIPASRFGSKKGKRIFSGSMLAISIVSFLTSTLSYVLYVAAPTAAQAADTYLGNDAYGMAGLLADPFGFLQLALRTFFKSGDGFIETMLGMQLGWLNIDVSRFVIYGMLLLMILSVLYTESDRQQEGLIVTVPQKITFFMVSVCSVGIVFASMFMSWTPKGSTAIEGIQGRYFLPLLPILLLLFRNQNVVVKRDMSKKMMYIAVSLQCVAIYGILMSLERIL